MQLKGREGFQYGKIIYKIALSAHALKGEEEEEEEEGEEEDEEEEGKDKRRYIYIYIYFSTRNISITNKMKSYPYVWLLSLHFLQINPSNP